MLADRWGTSRMGAPSVPSFRESQLNPRFVRGGGFFVSGLAEVGEIRERNSKEARVIPEKP